MDLMDSKLPGAPKNKKKKKPTLRFEIDLPDSTNDSCPEYSYVELVRETLKEKKSKGENDTMCQDLLEEEEEKERNEAEALAQYYEIKYGATAVAGQKRKRKDRIRDLVDAGYGYDENDPFVDDSEAYDEIVPASLTTQHGGFYINTGKLNFREASDQSDLGNTSSDDSIPLAHHAAKKKKLKMKNPGILDTDESDDEFRKENREEKKKKKKKLNEHKEKRKISLTGKDKVNLNQSNKKIKTSSTSYAQKLVAKAKAQQMMNASSLGSPAHSANGTVTPHRKSSSEDHGNMKSKIKELGGLEGILDKDLAQVAKQATKKLMNVGSLSAAGDSDVSPFKANGAEQDTSKNLTSSTDNLELPPGLPELLGDKIESLKKLAKSAEGEGKQKFFSSNVNRILLGIEEGSQSLRTKVRNGMYQHIANHLPCSKDTLMKRVKKLQVDDCDKHLKGPIDKLRAGVDAVMTMQIQNYLTECALQSKSDSLPAASTDEDDECEDRTSSRPAEGSGESGGEKVKRTYAPRRKFKWDENLRNRLCDVVRVKMNIYQRFKVREKQTPEEYLKAFLESVVKPLWPKPWMQTRILFKESRSAHSYLTNSNSCQKQKKASSGKKPTSTSKDGKTADTSSKNDVKPVLPSASANAASVQQKTSKKQLLYDNHHEVPGRQNAQLHGHEIINLTESPPRKNLASLASGSVEIVASIESEGSPASSPSAWKTHPVAKNKAPAKSVTPSREAAKEKQPSSSSAKPKPSAPPKPEKKKQAQEILKFQSDARSMSEQFYPSDWLKIATSLMMAPHGATSTPGFLPAGGMPNMDNYETISKILGLKAEDVIRANEKAANDKFQFKIAAPSTSFDHLLKGERSATTSAFHTPEKGKGKNFANGVTHSSEKGATAMNKTGRPTEIPHVLKSKDQGVLKQKGYSSLPGTPRESFMPMPGTQKQRPERHSPVLSGHGYAMSDFQTPKFTAQRSHASQRAAVNEKKNNVLSDSFRLKVSGSCLDSSPRLHVPSPSFVQSFSSSSGFKTGHTTLSSTYPTGQQLSLARNKYVPPTSPMSRANVSVLATREGYSGQLSSPQTHSHLSASSLGSHPVGSRSAMSGSGPHMFAGNLASISHVAAPSSNSGHALPQVKLYDAKGQFGR